MKYNKSKAKTYKPKKYNKKSYRKSKKTPLMVSSQLMVPPRFFTTLEFETIGKMKTGVAQQNNFFWIDANNLVAPLNTTWPLTSCITQTNSSTLTQSFKGLSPLSNLYQDYRINGSSISLSCMDSNISDTLQWIIVPFSYNNSSNFTQTGTPTFVASLPNSKERIITASNTVKDASLKHKCRIRDILGLTKIQYQCMSPVQVTDVAPSTNQRVGWFCQFNTLNGSNMSQEATVLIKLKVLVEFSRPNLTQTAP